MRVAPSINTILRETIENWSMWSVQVPRISMPGIEVNVLIEDLGNIGRRGVEWRTIWFKFFDVDLIHLGNWPWDKKKNPRGEYVQFLDIPLSETEGLNAVTEEFKKLDLDFPSADDRTVLRVARIH